MTVTKSPIDPTAPGTFRQLNAKVHNGLIGTSREEYKRVVDILTAYLHAKAAELGVTLPVLPDCDPPASRVLCMIDGIAIYACDFDGLYVDLRQVIENRLKRLASADSALQGYGGSPPPTGVSGTPGSPGRQAVGTAISDSYKETLALLDDLMGANSAVPGTDPVNSRLARLKTALSAVRDFAAGRISLIGLFFDNPRFGGILRSLIEAVDRLYADRLKLREHEIKAEVSAREKALRAQREQKQPFYSIIKGYDLRAEEKALREEERRLASEPMKAKDESESESEPESGYVVYRQHYTAEKFIFYGHDGFVDAKSSFHEATLFLSLPEARRAQDVIHLTSLLPSGYDPDIRIGYLSRDRKSSGEYTGKLTPYSAAGAPRPEALLQLSWSPPTAADRDFNFPLSREEVRETVREVLRESPELVAAFKAEGGDRLVDIDVDLEVTSGHATELDETNG